MAFHDTVVRMVQSSDPAALLALADGVNDAFGADAQQLAAQFRDTGGVAQLVAFLDDPSEEVRQCSMTVLGNLLQRFWLESQGGAPASIAQLQATHLESAL